nr:ACT domain-containing protein [Clostridia bacterium]
MNSEFLLIKADVLPDVFVKVMQVKRLLDAGKAESVNEAVRMVGLSRSAYYKYKDAVLPFYESNRNRVVTLLFAVENFPGILSGIINRIAQAQGNILTINQNFPLNGLADVSIAMETDQMNTELQVLMDDLGAI